jgi:hypothetical protein
MKIFCCSLEMEKFYGKFIFFYANFIPFKVELRAQRKKRFYFSYFSTLFRDCNDAIWCADLNIFANMISFLNPVELERWNNKINEFA